MKVNAVKKASTNVVSVLLDRSKQRTAKLKLRRGVIFTFFFFYFSHFPGNKKTTVQLKKQRPCSLFHLKHNDERSNKKRHLSKADMFLSTKENPNLQRINGVEFLRAIILSKLSLYPPARITKNSLHFLIF